MPGRLAFSMTCGDACEQRASPTLPRPQLTTLAHQNPRPSLRRAVCSQSAPAARIHVVRSYVVVKRLGARGTNSGDLITHPDAWPHRNVLLKAATPANLHTIAHRPATWHHIRHDRERERSTGELVFRDEARGRRPRSSRLSQCNSGVAGRGRDRTSSGHVLPLELASSRPKQFCIYYYYSTHRPLSSMHLEY